MKKIVWVNGNKMLFESAHSTFNRQTNLISTGNIISNTQRGGYVRPYTETECNGFTRPPGHLRDFDLNGWDRMPGFVRDKVCDLTETEPVILYRFHHYKDDGWLVTDGWVITSTDHELLWSTVTGPTWKSESVIDEAIKYVTANGG